MSNYEIIVVLMSIVPFIFIPIIENTPDEVLFSDIDIIFTRPYSWIKAIVMLLGGRIVCRVFNGYYVLKLDKWIRE